MRTFDVFTENLRLHPIFTPETRITIRLLTTIS